MEEDVNAFYGQADFATDRLRGNFGVRLVRTESDSTSWQCIGKPSCVANEANNWVHS